jgi:hypothetical protein
MVNNNPTPETNTFAVKFKTTCGEKYWVPVDLTRKLERERDNLKEIIKIVAEDKDKQIQQITVERDSAREAYKTLHNLYTDEIVKNNKLQKELEEYRSIAESIGATKAVSEKEKAIHDRDKARESIENITLSYEQLYANHQKILAEYYQSSEDLHKQIIQLKNELADALQEIDLRTLDFERIKDELIQQKIQP